MGWFDNEQEADNMPNAAAPQPNAPRPAVHRPPSADSNGSTLGREIHIDGAIVCDEDLTILGRVDGTIRAKGTLVIAKEADVHAKIDGQRVLVHGKVNGNVQGAELVVIGQTGHLTGNIKTPTLEIVEGAHFKGSVDMKAAHSSPAEAPGKPPGDKSKAAAGPGDKPKDAAASAGGGGADEKAKPAAGATGEGSAGAQKQTPG